MHIFIEFYIIQLNTMQRTFIVRHPFPATSEINRNFFFSYGKFDIELWECYIAINATETWDELAAGDIRVSDRIFAKLETTGSCHSGASWMCLLGHYRYIAVNGFPERFLMKNQHLWVMGYYMPDYLAEMMFITGAGVISALALLS
jgi:hypothetical protein